jgi:Fibronectin type III domain
VPDFTLTLEQRIAVQRPDEAENEVTLSTCSIKNTSGKKFACGKCHHSKFDQSQVFCNSIPSYYSVDKIMKPNFTVRSIAIVFATLLFSSTNNSFSSAQGLDAPSDLVAQASVPGDLAVSLYWIDNSLTEDGFEIQRSTGIGSTNFITIDVVLLNNISSYNDVGLDEHTTYNYRVRAFYGAEVSGFSGVATAMTSYARPDQISGLQGEVIGGFVGLTWIDNATNETRYEVERAEVGVSTQFTTIATLAPDATSYVDETGLDGAVYDYRVRPWRFDVEGGAPDVVTVDMGPGIASPTSVSARAISKTSIELSWKGPVTQGTSVQIQRFNLDSGLWATIGQVKTSDRKFRDKGLTTQTMYIYRLRAVTTTAVSPWVSAVATTK